MKIRVDQSQAGIGDLVFAGGEHDVELTPELAPLFAGAAAAGAIEITTDDPAELKLLAGHVQTQEDGEAANAEAHEDGTWQPGNLQAFVLGREDRLGYDDALRSGEVVDEETPLLTDAQRTLLEFQLTQAREQLDDLEAV